MNPDFWPLKLLCQKKKFIVILLQKQLVFSINSLLN